MDNNDIVCTCFSVTKAEIIKVIKEKNLKTVDEVGEYVDAGTACGSCIPDIKKILDEEIK